MSLEKLSETLQGTICYHYPPDDYSIDALKEIVKFRGMVEQRIQNQEPPLQSIPQEYLSLIAKLGHERWVFYGSDIQFIDISGSFSDKTLAALTKHMQQELIPPQEGDEDSMLASAKSVLPLGVVEQAIKSVLHRNNYGLEASTGLRTPAAVCVWRWEIDENYKSSLPKSVQEKVETRLQERIQVCTSLLFVPLKLLICPRRKTIWGKDFKLSLNQNKLLFLIQRAPVVVYLKMRRANKPIWFRITNLIMETQARLWNQRRVLMVNISRIRPPRVDQGGRKNLKIQKKVQRYVIKSLWFLHRVHHQQGERKAREESSKNRERNEGEECREQIAEPHN